MSAPRQPHWTSSAAILHSSSVLETLLPSPLARIPPHMRSLAQQQAAKQATIWMLCSFVADALAAASQGLVADALGRNDKDDAREVSLTVFAFSLILGVLLATGLQIGKSSTFLLNVFTSDVATQATLSKILALIILAQPLNSLVFAADGVIQGASEFTYSIGSSRGEGGGDSEVQRTMLELLNQLDGFEPAQNIKVVMATNRINILDAALLRPGCIDRKIEFPNPNVENRTAIMRIHSRKMNLLRNIDLEGMAKKMINASGAECKAVCTEAGMFALREMRVHVTQEDSEMAVSKVMKKDSDNNISLQRLWK